MWMKVDRSVALCSPRQYIPISVPSSDPTHYRKNSPCCRPDLCKKHESMPTVEWRWKWLHALLVSQVVMDQLNPGLKNLVNLGKSYEKSVTGKCGFRAELCLRKCSQTDEKANKVVSAGHVMMCFFSPRSYDPGWKGLFWCCVKGWWECHGLASLQGAWWVVHCGQSWIETIWDVVYQLSAQSKKYTAWFATDIKWVIKSFQMVLYYSCWTSNKRSSRKKVRSFFLFFPSIFFQCFKFLSIFLSSQTWTQ